MTDDFELAISSAKHIVPGEETYFADSGSFVLLTLQLLIEEVLSVTIVL